jgi:hypothetical protein
MSTSDTSDVVKVSKYIELTNQPEKSIAYGMRNRNFLEFVRGNTHKLTVSMGDNYNKDHDEFEDVVEIVINREEQYQEFVKFLRLAADELEKEYVPPAKKSRAKLSPVVAPEQKKQSTPSSTLPTNTFSALISSSTSDVTERPVNPVSTTSTATSTVSEPKKEPTPRAPTGRPRTTKKN